ncbi:MAG: hypothetical protein HZB38_06805 [Planctomycetes bacterium]|nr:hypothetical protein [Planctomycetota bacterium]
MKRNTWMALIAAFAAALPAFGDELADAQKKIVDAWAATRSVSAKMNKKADQTMPNGNRLRTEGDGAYEMAREGDKIRFRTETSVNTAIKLKDSENEMKLSTTQTLIDDGETLYSIQSGMGKTSATREGAANARREPAINDRKAFFEAQARNNELKLASADRVSGVDCYVIEASPKVAGANAGAKMRYAFAKDSGMLMKVAKLGANDAEVDTETYSDVKINEKIDPQRFVFKAPEGVTVREKGVPAVAAPKPPASGPTSAPASAPAKQP